MNNGFVVIWRKFQDTSFYKDSYAVHLALHLIMEANHEPKKFTFNQKEENLERGQLLTGRKVLSEATGISESTIYRKLELFENIGFLTRKVNNKFTILTICNYSKYQDKKQKLEQPANNQRTTSEQQTDTNNNDNNDNNTTIVGKNPTTEAREFFYLKYKETVGKEYVPDFAKDGKIFKDLLKATPIGEIKSAVEAFFKSDDEFIQQAGFTVGVFRTQVNKLRQVKHGNVPASLRPFMGKG